MAMGCYKYSRDILISHVHLGKKLPFPHVCKAPRKKCWIQNRPIRLVTTNWQQCNASCWWLLACHPLLMPLSPQKTLFGPVIFRPAGNGSDWSFLKTDQQDFRLEITPVRLFCSAAKYIWLENDTAEFTTLLTAYRYILTTRGTLLVGPFLKWITKLSRQQSGCIAGLYKR